MSTSIASAAQQRLDALAKPPGSLGRLEELGVRLAVAQGRAQPSARWPRVIVFAGDHGVASAWPVSPYPSAVTQAMVHTFASGRAAVSALARSAGATLEVVDCGVAGLGPVQAGEGVRVHRTAVAAGTADLVTGPAMTSGQLEAALAIGRAAADRAASDGVDLLALGEMGIGNTTPATALAARLLERPAVDLVGPGTGLHAAGVSRKAELIQRALDRGGAPDPAGALADLGGFEIAALVGCLLQARRHRIPVLLDGFIVSAAALVALRLDAGVREQLIPTTRSAEPGHAALLEAIGAGEPLLDWGLRLGEASAATLCIPLARAACAVMAEMATLAEVLGAAE
jgi:nicotinate-nucleotide--dimethylbenzimidazole phosphoribosyltransferase